MLATTKESYIQDSMLMSKMLGKMGYTVSNRERKRKLLFTYNECCNIIQKAFHHKHPLCMYTVGSMIECTTLKDSDNDHLLGPSTEHVAAISSTSERKGGRENILIVRNAMSPPGHVWLKLLSNTSEIPATRFDMTKHEETFRLQLQYKIFSDVYSSSFEVPDVDKHPIFHWPGTLFIDDSDLQFYIPNNLYTLIAKQLWAEKAVKRGPCFNVLGESDFPRTIFCANTYPSNQDPIMIGGKKYGNLHVPKEYPCNIVPIGHRESADEMLEWRISHSLTEREIIFSFNNTHIITYVVLKMIQRNYFKHIIGIDFTSYHCKTSLYHTIASNAITIWREDNLINCVRQCLRTIRIFVKKNFCPHFFNKAFNIFSGKLPRCGKHWGSLIECVDFLVENPQTYFQCIENENQKLVHMKEFPIESQEFVCHCSQLLSFLTKYTLFTPRDINIMFQNERNKIREKRLQYKELQRNVEIQIERSTSGFQRKCAEVLLSFVKVRHYLLSAAYLLEQGKKMNPIVPENILPDALSMDLQMSSLLFASGNYEPCRSLLERVYSKMITYPILYHQFYHRPELTQSDMNDFFNRYNGRLPITDIPEWTFIKRHVSLQVTFLVHELCLLHPLLRFEAFRYLFQDRRNMFSTDDNLLPIVRFDVIPFFFFMQYLVYKELGPEEQKYEALVRLEVCINYSSLSYQHIAMNMLGICCELERNYDIAFSYYARSLEVRPRFNAAIFHIALLVWRFWVRHNMELQADLFINVLNIID